MNNKSTNKVVTVHAHCRVAPPAEMAEQGLSLTYFDVTWVHFHPIQRLVFYKFPCSTVHFYETIVPNLKESLSQTLKHFLPLAGNLYLPILNNPGFPEFRYVPGDTVSVTIAESSEDFDFDYWTGNQARDADEFYAFVPELSEPRIDSDSGLKIIPLVAVQVTVFPGMGICLGFSNNHAIGDANSIVRFIKSWSAVAKLGKDADYEFLAKNELLPFFDRSVIKDPSQKRVNIFWNEMKKRLTFVPPPSFPTTKFRETFLLQKSELQKLRNSALAKKPELDYLSSFTISVAYVWSCIAKTASKSGEAVDENAAECIIIAADARPRMDPPAPASYFGNCLVGVVTESTHGRLKGDLGFCTAVELIGELITKQANNKEELLKDADDWLVKYKPLFGKRVFAVSGSPKFDLYDTDFGWGKAHKLEAVSIDKDSSMSIFKSRDLEGGLEIGMSLSKQKLDAFAAIFADGLEE